MCKIEELVTDVLLMIDVSLHPSAAVGEAGAPRDRDASTVTALLRVRVGSVSITSH